MKRVVIIGAGGHAREVADILRHQIPGQSEFRLLGSVVEDREFLNQVSDGISVLGDWTWFEQANRDELDVVCAIGSPTVRKRLVERAISIGLSFTNVISPLAYVSPDAKIGKGTMIFSSAVVSTNSTVGDHSIINFGSTISHDARVGDFVTISPGVHVAGNVSLSEGCYLGIGSSVIERTSIGAWTIVGAGAVVTRDMPDNVTVVGVPAEVIKRDKESP